MFRITGNTRYIRVYRNCENADEGMSIAAQFIRIGMSNVKISFREPRPIGAVGREGFGPYRFIRTVCQNTLDWNPSAPVIDATKIVLESWADLHGEICDASQDDCV